MIRHDAKSTQGPATEHVTCPLLHHGHVLQNIASLILHFATQIVLLGVKGGTKQDGKQYMDRGLQTDF